MDSVSNGEPAVVEGFLVRLSGRVWGIALGTLFGGGLFLATEILVLKGGSDVGQHLGLLGQYLPFYNVTALGGVVGLLYGFAIGYLAGRSISFVYNRLAR